MLIFMPMSPSSIVPVLAMAGLGLGIFVPADNAVIISAARAGSASVLAAAAAEAALIAAAIPPLGAVAGQAHETGPSGAFG
jgi:hypothetical protein